MRATAHRFEPVSYTQLRHGDRVQISQMNRDVFIRWSWRLLTVDYVDWIRDDRTALMLHLTQPAIPGGDRFTLIVGRATIEAGVRRVIDPTPASSKEQPVKDQPGEPMTRDSLAAIEAAITSPAGPSASDLRALLAEAERARADADDQYAEADYWRESYRLTKGLSDDEINAIAAVRDASRCHPRPCEFPHEACLCEDQP